MTGQPWMPRVPRIVKQEVTHFKRTSLYTHTFQLVTLTV